MHLQLPHHEAARRLDGCGYPALRNVDCEFQSGTLRLKGRVSSFYQKQVAQTVVTQIDGVRLVVNELEVAAG